MLIKSIKENIQRCRCRQICERWCITLLLSTSTCVRIVSILLCKCHYLCLHCTTCVCAVLVFPKQTIHSWVQRQKNEARARRDAWLRLSRYSSSHTCAAIACHGISVPWQAAIADHTSTGWHNEDVHVFNPKCNRATNPRTAVFNPKGHFSPRKLFHPGKFSFATSML